MATFDVAKLLNKITQDIPGINTVLKALAKWDVSALTDVPDGAMQATTDTNNRLTIKKKVSDSYTPVAKLMHDVDLLDGYHASASATANTVAVRNAQGALPGNITGNAATADTAVALAAGSVVPLNQGGTEATTASQARTNLGAAGSADFTAHIAKQSSSTVEGHVKLDALAADGSNTAAPGGFGLGKSLSLATDYNNCVVNGWYYGSNSTANKPPTTANYHVFVQALNPSNVLQKAYQFSGSDYYTRVCSSGVWSEWVQKPIGITDSTSTTSSTVAASATAVKTAYDKAASALGRTDPATTTSRGIGKVATLADMGPDAVIENGPAFLAAGSEALNALVPTFLIGSIISTYAADGYVPNGCVLPDGAEYTASQFPSFYTDYLTAGRVVTCTYAEFAAQVALTGNCGKFAIDTVNQKFKVPLLKDGDSITHAASAGEVGKSVKAGLPDAKGSTSSDLGAGGVMVERDYHGTGVYSGSSLVKLQWGCPAGSWQGVSGLDFALSNYDPIYGNSTTVTDEQVRLRHFVVLASAQNNSSMFDWSNYMAALAGKANNDLSNLEPAVKMSLLGIGVGQAWLDVKGSRVAGTTYTNTTEKPIMVAISLLDTGAGSSSFKVDGKEIVIGDLYGAAQLTMIVPNGATYRLNMSGASLATWLELR